MSTLTGRTGQLELTGNQAGITVLVEWVETYNALTNTSQVTISNLQVKSSIWYNVVYYLNGNISVDGFNVQTFNSAAGTHSVYLLKKNTYASIQGKKLPPWVSAEIEHNSDGTKTVDILVSITGYTGAGNAGSGWVVDEVVSIALTDIPVPEPEPDPDIPEPEPEPEPKEPVMIFAYDGELVLFPRYERTITGFIIIPPVLGTKTTVTGTVIRVDDVVNTGHALEITAAEGTDVYVYGKNLIETASVDAEADKSKVLFEGSVTGDFVFSCLFNYTECKTPTAAQFEFMINGAVQYMTRGTADLVSKKINGTLTRVRFLNWGYGVGTVNSIQLEVGTAATEYEVYKDVQTAVADESGKVTGLKSVAPTMTIVADAEAEVTYYSKD